MSQLYLQRFEYRGAIGKAEFDQAWGAALQTFARCGNWEGPRAAPQFCGLKHDHERYSRQMPLQINCATFEGRREPRRRVRRMFKPNSRDRRSRGSRLVRLFRPQNCGFYLQ